MEREFRGLLAAKPLGMVVVGVKMRKLYFTGTVV